MEPAKISFKNQVVIPKAIRKTMGVKAGDEIFFVSRNGTVYLLPTSGSFVDDLKGIARRGGVHYPKSYLKKEHRSW